ncbi:MAG: hypothetical protein HYY84_04430 [Deltaproteobacteria bacterium]|nr:hypothetical protein [Deltaproteobacteria bacterium]
MRGYASLGVWSSCCALLAAFGCTTKKESTSRTIATIHKLPADFLPAVASSIQQIVLLVDERPGQSGIYEASQDVTCQTVEGLQTCTDIGNFDSDSNLEARVRVQGTPFASQSTYTMFIQRAPVGEGIRLVGEIQRLDGGVLETVANAEATTTDEGGLIDFGSGQKTVTLTYACAPYIACRSADTIPPETTITGAPGVLATLPAVFSFVCNESVCSFACSIDDAGATACTSPHTIASLADGTHTFFVRATDDAGNADPTPAQVTWTSDGTRPFSSLSIDGAAFAFGSQVSVSGTASDNLSGLALLEVSTDGGGSWVARPVDGGAWSHTFPAAIFSHRVLSRATDDAGNVETPDGGAVIYTTALPAIDLLGYTNRELNREICRGVPGATGLWRPRGVTLYGSWLYVVDSNNNRVLAFSSSGGNPIDHIADGVIGQPDLDSCGARLTATGLNGPTHIATGDIDMWTTALFVSDTANNRVIAYATAKGVCIPPCVFATPDAGWVLGQTDFTTADAGSGLSQMNGPEGLAFDGKWKRLFVADRNNNRVLIFAIDAGLTTGQPAIAQIGDPTCPPYSASVTCLRTPRGVVHDPEFDRLFVSDSANRVLVFNLDGGLPIFDGGGVEAANLLGQTSFTGQNSGTSQSAFSSPAGIAYASNKFTGMRRLFVADEYNNRVLAFDVSAMTDASVPKLAVTVLGQSRFDAGGAGVGSGMSEPRGVWASDSNLIVADSRNNRILFFKLDGGSADDGSDAGSLLGHHDPSGFPVWDSDCSNGPNRVNINAPSVAVADGARRRIFVADIGGEFGDVARVLVFPTDDAGEIADRTASAVLGQPDFAHCYRPHSQPVGGNAATDPRRDVGIVWGMELDRARNLLFVSDYALGRILVWDVANLVSGAPASYVLGKPDFDGGAWASAPTATNLSSPTHLALDATRNRLFVADFYRNGVVVFDVTTLSNGQAATNVLGQGSLTTADAGSGASGLRGPLGVAHQVSTNRLFVSDFYNARVVVFDLANMTTGMAASFVLGKTSLTAALGAPASQTELVSPLGVAVDDTRKRLFVAEYFASRVVAFDLASGPTNGMPAFNVIGQRDFQTIDAGIGAQGLYVAGGVNLDPTGRRLYVGDWGGARLLVFDVGP